MARAAVLAEGALGSKHGKTANGLVLHARNDTIVAVIDSTQTGQDAGTVVVGKPNGIPVVADLSAAIQLGAEKLFLGVANIGGRLPPGFKPVILQALEAGLEVVNGLHLFLSDTPEYVAAAQRGGGRIWDVRKPPTDMRCSDGMILDRNVPRILIMGQDCDIGKRVTAFQLLDAAKAKGVDVGFVATGQTGCMLGADAGAVIDRIPGDFASGQVEKMVCDVSDGVGRAKAPDAVVIYGQASLFHPSFSGVTLAILQGCVPDAVILQVAPGRRQRVLFDHPGYTVAPVVREIDAIELLGDTQVVAIALNPSESEDPVRDAKRLAGETGLPVLDPLGGDAGALWDVVWEAVTRSRQLAAA